MHNLYKKMLILTMFFAVILLGENVDAQRYNSRNRQRTTTSRRSAGRRAPQQAPVPSRRRGRPAAGRSPAKAVAGAANALGSRGPAMQSVQRKRGGIVRRAPTNVPPKAKQNAISPAPANNGAGEVAENEDKSVDQVIAETETEELTAISCKQKFEECVKASGICDDPDIGECICSDDPEDRNITYEKVAQEMGATSLLSTDMLMMASSSSYETSDNSRFQNAVNMCSKVLSECTARVPGLSKQTIINGYKTSVIDTSCKRAKGNLENKIRMELLAKRRKAEEKKEKKADMKFQMALEEQRHGRELESMDRKLAMNTTLKQMDFNQKVVLGKMQQSSQERQMNFQRAMMQDQQQFGMSMKKFDYRIAKDSNDTKLQIAGQRIGADREIAQMNYNLKSTQLNNEMSMFNTSEENKLNIATMQNNTEMNIAGMQHQAEMSAQQIQVVQYCSSSCQVTEKEGFSLFGAIFSGTGGSTTSQDEQCFSNCVAQAQGGMGGGY